MKQALRYNNKVVKKIYQGDELVKKMNYGQSSDVFQYIKNDGDTPTPPAPSYDEQYLTIETLTAGDLSLANADSNVFNYSLDNGSTWNALAMNQTVAVEANKKVLFKAQWPTANPENGIGTINYTGNFNVYGNIMSLAYGDDFIGQEDMDYYQFCTLFSENTTLTSAENLVLPATTLADNCYSFMFYGCSGLTVAPELPATTLTNSCYLSMFDGCRSLVAAPELPATTLADACYGNMFQNCTNLTTAPELPATTLTDGCYYSMFRNCTSLTTAPELPATTLTNSCYLSMFDGCTSLTTAPALPATTLAGDCCNSMFANCTSLTTAPSVLPATTLAYECYRFMFYGCTNLTAAPELPATTLANSCYQDMFNGCANLNYIKCLATNISVTRCTKSWVSGVSSTGTFVKNAAMTGWTTGENGIPRGWTVVNA